MKKIKKSNIFTKLSLMIATAFIVRFLFSLMPSFDVDMGAWLYWADRLANLGPSRFYSNEIWTQYTPGYLYILLIIGKLKLANPLVIKAVSSIFDIGIGYVLYKISKKSIYFWAYVISPAVIFVGSVWGQIDGILTFFMLLSAIYIVEKKNLYGGMLFWIFAFLIKPQAISIIIPLTLIILTSFKLKEIIRPALVGLAALIILTFPFFPSDNIFGLYKFILSMGADYQYTSLYAYNIWNIISDMWVVDSQTFLYLSYFYWGVIFFAFANLFLIYKYFKSKKEAVDKYLFISLGAMTFFLFPTRVHERYLFPFLVFILLYTIKSNKKIWLYAITSIIFLLNLYYPYAYYSPQSYLRQESLMQLINYLSPAIGLGYLYIFWELANSFSLNKKFRLQFNMSFNKKYILPAILIFSFLSRIFMLHNPPQEYFDEVYHAFTAQVMLEGDPRGWEWWNTPPAGFAYEWTHPPLAKEIMAFSMAVFGVKAWAWRLPAALLGTLALYLIYKIALFLFKNHDIALLSAFIMSVDGLVLVMNRIGMNDTYLLVFMLFSLYLYLEEKYDFSAVSLGFAAASKWSVLWFIPVIVLFHLSLRRKIIDVKLLWYLAVPLVYLLTYTPFFATGHSWSDFIGLHKQMWWYHTRLDATHPYTSPWWSWPILIRPIWLYTSGYIQNMVSNIYALGNPAVFWSGFIAIIYSFYKAYITKNKKLFLVIFSYLMFFVPWALSPRIMFLYHYLPSMPFLAMILAWALIDSKVYTKWFIFISLLLFIYFYPHWTGIKVPISLDASYYWLSSWK